MWNFRLRKKKKCCETVLTGEVPDGLNLELNTEKPPTLYTPPPYVEPTDKEMIEGLYESERPEEAFRLQQLKKENAALKGKLTKLTKKANAYKEDLDNANSAVKQLLQEINGTKQP